MMKLTKPLPACGSNASAGRIGLMKRPEPKTLVQP